jgi:hypothetical protein
MPQANSLDGSLSFIFDRRQADPAAVFDQGAFQAFRAAGDADFSAVVDHAERILSV